MPYIALFQLSKPMFHFLITYKAFTINFNRSHEFEEYTQEKMQLNINLVLKRIKLNYALTIDQNILYYYNNTKMIYYTNIIK